jgi:predicted DNA-binding transcriptional regulator AlpA
MSQAIAADIKGQVADNLAAALDRLAEQHARKAVQARPEWMRDNAIRAEYFGDMSRTSYWVLTKRPDFPKARLIGDGIKIRRRSEIEQWIADQPEVA